MNNLNECLGAEPAFNWTLRDIYSSLRGSRQIEPPSQPYCIVFQLDEGRGTVHKMSKIISTWFKIAFFRLACRNHRALTTKVYGVYPTVENPVVIYEFHSEAERYVLGNVIPSSKKSLASRLRALVERVTNINPALGGVALLMQKERDVPD